MPEKYGIDHRVLHKPMCLQWMANYLRTHKRYRVIVDVTSEEGFKWNNVLWHFVQGLARTDPDLHVMLYAEQDPEWMELRVI